MKLIIFILLAMCGHAISQFNFGGQTPFSSGLSAVRPPFIIQPVDSNGRVRVAPEGNTGRFNQPQFTPSQPQTRGQQPPQRPLISETPTRDQINPNRRPSQFTSDRRPNSGFGPSTPARRPPTVLTPGRGPSTQPQNRQPNRGRSQFNPARQSPTPNRQQSFNPNFRNQQNPQSIPNGIPLNINIVHSNDIRDEDRIIPTIFLEPPSRRKNRKRPATTRSRRPSTPRVNPEQVVLLQLQPTTNSQNPRQSSRQVQPTFG